MKPQQASEGFRSDDPRRDHPVGAFSICGGCKYPISKDSGGFWDQRP